MPRASPKMKANVQKLIEERDRLLAQMNGLKHKIEGIELAIQVLGRDDVSAKAADTSKRGNAKALLLDLLREVGTTGLNATSAVEMGARRGVKLERGTAASNLSRMKADNVVTYDGDKYRLPEFSRTKPGVVVKIVGEKGIFEN
jgi:hypothetical protein